MKERERIIAIGLTLLMLILWLGFLVHRSPRFAGSLLGGLLGVSGALLMLVPLAYVAVKRSKWLKAKLKKYVSMRTLLTWHVYAGIAGPILVVLHTGHKFESPLGIVLTALMLVVVVSGFVGRYLMSQFSTEIRAKKTQLVQLEEAYQQGTAELAGAPERAALLQPFTGFLGRLAATLFVRELPGDAAPVSAVSASNAATLLRLVDAIADLQYAIKTHEAFKAWFSKWLKFHLMISISLYILMVLHIWAAVHFGLRWFAPSSTGHFSASAYATERLGNTGPVRLTAKPDSVSQPLAPGDAVGAFSAHFRRMFQRYWRPPVTIHGIRTTVFDYGGIAREAAEPESDFSAAVAALARVDPDALDGADGEKAFWINVYNFTAMKLAAEHYPVRSIIDPKISADDPWGVPAVRIGQERYSLKQIENAILLKQFNDSRIVFAISCAAVSCPDRTDEVFSAERIDEQLDSIIRGLLANPSKGLKLDRDRNVLKLSWILKADRRLFGGTGQGVLQFVHRYAPADVAEWMDEHEDALTIEYFSHDWSLNDVVLDDAQAETEDEAGPPFGASSK